MTCFGSPGTGMPHVSFVREMERSWSPPETKLMTSLRRLSGCDELGVLLVEAQEIGRVLRLRRKKYVSSFRRSAGVRWMGHRLPGWARSFSVLYSSQPTQYQPSYEPR